MSAQVVITDCLGRTRSPVETCEDGSYNCPFCYAAVQAGTPEYAKRTCPNPACFAREGFPPEKAQELIAEDARRKREEEDRKELHRIRMESAEVEARLRQQRQDAIAYTAREKGACVRCALDSARYGRPAKFTRHRGNCPKR